MGFDWSERYRQDPHDQSYQLAAEQPGRGRFQQQRGSNLLFALLVFGMFISYQSILIPLIQFLQQALVYIFLGRFFVRGLLAGSVKG
jgi:ABC-type glycerol-3-phosphate transport system permease component